MSESGQTRKYPHPRGRSVLPSGADIARLYAQVRFVPRAAVMLAKLIENTLSQGRSRLACHYRFGESRDQVPRLNVLKAGFLDEGPNETGRQDDSFRAIEHAGEEP
jgi:hypothetical protein